MVIPNHEVGDSPSPDLDQLPQTALKIKISNFSRYGKYRKYTSVAVARGSVAPRRVESPHTRD